ncbi:RING finger protein vilya [Glossina fuscipes]|uniref:RING finger protein vilya n=1 Tax=Glossina fuscipes TaxID=7396 RepID=A0A8U0WJP9_9MUSC|nr:RING finger protein vilya [Glossina fuscipes]
MNLSSKKVPFLEWIHCNSCYDLYVNKTRIFYLVAGCFHVLCAKCIREVKPAGSNGPSHYKCAVCNKAARACEINNNMPTNLKNLFHPFPNEDDMNLFAIVQFQQRHQQRFRNYLDRMNRSLKENKAVLLKRRDAAKTTYQELRETRAERKQLERRLLMVKKRYREMEEKKLNQSISHNANESSKLSVHTNDPRLNRPALLNPAAEQISINLSGLKGPRMPPPALFKPNVQNNSTAIASFMQQSESFVL